MLRARRDELGAALAYVEGRVELGVKAWVPDTQEEPEETPTSGRGYLQQRLGARDAARRAASALAGAVDDAHARLLRHAVDGVANRPQPRELTGRAGRMLLNGAYLVDDPTPLREEVAQLSDEHAPAQIVFELTGPWPPYNFVGEGA
jgi:hypothetical protein